MESRDTGGIVLISLINDVDKLVHTQGAYLQLIIYIPSEHIDGW